jgi:bifunctional non-homologous end joining protein LigD
MGLNEYKKKRTFQHTPEPKGGKASGGQLLFVIQKHAASRLHYDFRLELRGVLKSWAVPKGPSLNPADKRLAMLVEDHPFDYKDFEGNIPKGNYGAGTVIIWDQGTYEPLEQADSKAEQEKILLKGFHAGQIKFRMHGKKLKGEFVLVRTAYRGENTWLLIKHRDEYASDEDITLKDKSVVSGKTLEQVAASYASAEWISNPSAEGSYKEDEADTSRKAPAKRKATVKRKAAVKAPAKKKPSAKRKTTR